MNTLIALQDPPPPVRNPYSNQNTSNTSASDKGGKELDTMSKRNQISLEPSPFEVHADINFCRESELAWLRQEIDKIQNFACTSVHEGRQRNVDFL